MNLTIKQRIVLFSILTVISLILALATAGIVHTMWGVSTIFWGVQTYIDASDYIKEKRS